MKRRILFSVVSALLVYYISFQPVSGNNESPSAESETGIFESFLRKIDCGGKKIEEMTHSQLGRALQFLEDKIREEKKLRLFYQSRINIADWVESLFVKCWPGWAGARIPKQYPKEHWRLLLLNVEHQKILNLKIHLKKLEISNEFFVNTVEDLLKLGNLRADLQNYKLMSQNETKEAIKLLNEEYHADGMPKVMKILILGLNEPLLITNDEKEMRALQTNVKADTEKHRNSFRVLYFPKCKSPLCKEDAVELQLKIAANAFKMTNDSNNEGVINPLAVVATTNGTFVLFESFKDAYSIWCTRKKMEFAIGEMDGIRIIDANELSLFEVKKNESSHLVVKVESKSGKTIADTYDVISNKDFNDSPLESLIQRSAGSQSEENGKISVLYCYGHAIKALSTYEKLKKTIDKSANNVTLTCIPTNQTMNMRILNDEEVAKLKQQQ